ncbi:MAG TPA: DUF2336 domain-containing protein [Rhizobiaceae bacterium]|nr:DUF2336 domain-containing protein [Rhizobiaceae bacterium]
MPQLANIPSHPATDAGSLSMSGEATRRAAARARKAGLLGEAARNFCAIARPTQHDVTMFRELFYQLVDGSDKAERRVLSASLARNVYTPRTILLYLARDEYDIAAPVLLFSEALNEVDIKNLAIRLGQQSLEILCRRTSLTANAARSLIASGGNRCREILAKNTALKDDEEMQSLLAGIEPQDVEEVIAETRVGHLETVAANSRIEVEAEPQMVEAEPEPAAAVEIEAAPVARQDSLKDRLTALAARGGRLGREDTRQAAPAFDPAKPLEQQIVRAARAGDREFIASALEGWCEMPAQVSRAILAKGGARELIVFFKGVGLSDLGTIQCLLQLDAQIARNIAAYNEAKAMLAGLDVAACRRFVESLGANITKPVSQPVASKPIETQTEIDISALRAIASQRRREILASVGQAPSEIPAPLFSTLKSA